METDNKACNSVCSIGVSYSVSLAAKTSKVNSAQDRTIDPAIPLLATIDADLRQNHTSGYVLFDRTLLSAAAPSYTSSLHILWSPYTYTYGSLSQHEDKERLFQYFYFLGVDERKLEELLKGIYIVPRFSDCIESTRL